MIMMISITWLMYGGENIPLADVSRPTFCIILHNLYLIPEESNSQ